MALMVYFQPFVFLFQHSNPFSDLPLPWRIGRYFVQFGCFLMVKTEILSWVQNLWFLSLCNKKIYIVTFRLPRLSSMIFSSPSFGVLLVAAFPRMKFCGKIRNKNNEKEIFMDPTLCFIFHFV
jgi:hypothetical protein